MAEAAGLALGAVALVSLFQTTVELLEYVQAGKGLASDGQLADTKLGLLEERLRQWGDDLHVEHPGKEDGWLRQCWDHEGGLVTKSLKGISEILSNASQLSEKYGLHKKRRLVWNSNIPSLYPIIQKTNTLSLSSPRKSSGISPSVRKQAVWAIKDKKRFDSLIADLDFFITNLEKVSGRLIKLGECYSHDNRSLALSQASTLSTMASSNGNGQMTQLAEARHKRHGTPAYTEIIPANGTMARDSISSPGQETHHSYTDVTADGRAFAPMGDIDTEIDRNHKYKNIKATGYSFAPVGNTKSEGLVKLLKQYQAGPGYEASQNEPASQVPQPSPESGNSTKTKKQQRR